MYKVFWRTGSSEAEDRNDQRSEVFTTSLVVCGFESFKAGNDEKMVVNAVKVGTDDQHNKLFVVKED